MVPSGVWENKTLGSHKDARGPVLTTNLNVVGERKNQGGRGRTLWGGSPVEHLRPGERGLARRAGPGGGQQHVRLIAQEPLRPAEHVALLLARPLQAAQLQLVLVFTVPASQLTNQSRVR